MKYKVIQRQPRTFVLVFETDDEVASGVKQFASEQNISAASLQAVGALSSVELAWFSWETKRYEPSIRLTEQVELLSLLGDIAVKDGEPQVHAHVVVGKSDGTAHGGHLVSARVRPTCEVIVVEDSVGLQRHIDPESGLALIKL